MDLSNNMLALLLALLSGIFMAIQGSLNAALSKVIGLIETTFVVHFIGTVILLLLLFVFKMGKGSLAAMPEAPWYVYLGGVISVFIIYLVAASIPKVGMANATTAIIVGQVLTAIIIDHYGGFGLEHMAWEWNDLAGLFLLTVGAYLLLK
ncbi:DMT family transporter [Propionispora vibrioides]|uniref:Transporter family-2 protein n=1 Tax=Propionispora vibrioides TaxID=112903 RepID=A0A1H8SHZ6_9FIRM|nr:DMT family transporter [Propionispora vibrioides]SEO78639.1 transporter family-2 protein [Propionispora vibrioides]